MKKGDKVRFLNENGGGIIAGFQGKNIVLVEDEDGFQIPTPATEVVVIEDANADAKALSRIEEKAREIETDELKKSVKQRLADNEDEELENWRDIDVEVKPYEDPSIGFELPAQERIGGNKLSVYIAYVPIDENQLSTTRFEAYLVNDSNYYISFAYQTADEDDQWTLRTHGEVEPNMKLKLEGFGRDDLNNLLKGDVQFFAYKIDKPFSIKSVYDIQVKLDAVKFYKQNAFRDNMFFEKPAILYTLVLDDKQGHTSNVEPKKMSLEVEVEKTQKQQPARVQETIAEEKLATLQKHFTEATPIAPTTKMSKKVMREDKIIIDLHANTLLETTQGMSSANILEYQLEVFRKTLDEYKGTKGQKVIFIHGKGEGVLRQALLHELNYRYKHYSYQDASFREYGYGATQVTIK